MTGGGGQSGNKSPQAEACSGAEAQQEFVQEAWGRVALLPPFTQQAIRPVLPEHFYMPGPEGPQVSETDKVLPTEGLGREHMVGRPWPSTCVVGREGIPSVRRWAPPADARRPGIEEGAELWN